MALAHRSDARRQRDKPRLLHRTGLTERVCVIANPSAGRGRGARALPAIRDAFAGAGVTDVRLTTGWRAEREIARRAIEEGCTTLVAAGGDGTCSNVANAILRSGSDTRLGIVPTGTGNDFFKTVAPSGASVPDIVRWCVSEAAHRVDVGRIEQEYFLNCCGFGFDVAVLQEIERTRWLRGSAVYVATAIRQLFSYDGLSIAVAAEGQASRRTLHMMLILANTRYFGGTFMIAPGASATDGALDAVAVHDVPALRRIRLLLGATRGRHVSDPSVKVVRSGRFDLQFDAAPAFELDGELHQAAAAAITVSCLAGALRIAAPGPV